MKTFARPAAVAVLAVWSSVSLAQDSAAPPAPAPPAPPAAAPAAPPSQAGAAASDEEFVPTEELSADEAVTFPVDI